MSYKKDGSGVYCLKTLNTKLIYIGSTKGLKRRKSLHKSWIKKQDRKRGNTEFIDAVKNGDSFEFNILELCDNYLEREQYWIDFYRQQNVYTIVNEFDADRRGSDCSNEFKLRMRKITTERWKDSDYRNKIIPNLLKTSFTPERLNKRVHVFNVDGIHIWDFQSAKQAAEELGLNASSIAAAARGNFKGKFKYKSMVFIYQEIGVHLKLDELLETHPELRAISSQAWEVFNSTTKVQRLISEQDKQ